MSTVTVPENKLAELQIKASQRDELLAALLLAKDMMLANNLYLPFTLEVIDDAIAKAKGE